MTNNLLREAITLAGEQAFRDGRRIYACPYPVETQKAFWWFEGYQKGWLKDVFSDVEAVTMEHGNTSEDGLGAFARGLNVVNSRQEDIKKRVEEHRKKISEPKWETS